jgi:GxxExxY protein
MKHRLYANSHNPADTGLLYSSITERTIGASFQVHKALGFGFLEKVYQNALLLEIKESEFEVESEVGINVFYKGTIVGEYRTDLLVAKVVAVELKVEQGYNKLHEAQLLNILKSTGLKVGLLLNFGRTKVEFKRFVF